MQFSLTILGCNSAVPSIQRNQSAQVLQVHERLFLIDCGEATQLQLRRFNIKLQRISHVFISHLHGDHYFGLIGLISTYHLMGRKNELHVYGHQELEQIINLQLNLSGSILSYPVIFHALNKEEPEVLLDDDQVRVETVLLNHKIPTHGFIFKEKAQPLRIKKEIIDELKPDIDQIKAIKEGNDFTDANGKTYTSAELTHEQPELKSYAYCSDTAYDERIIPFIKGVSLLYHESTFMNDRAEAAAEKFHATSIQAATIAKKAEVKRLLIGHFSARYDNVTPMLHESRTVFANTLLAEDGLKIDL